MIIYIVGDVCAFKSFFLGFYKQSLHLAVQAVSHQFQCDVRVAIDTRRLTLRCEEIKYFVNIGHVEVSAQTQVLCSPVISAQERVNKCQSALACGRVAQVSHVEFACHLLCYSRENLCYGILAFCLLAEHIFCSWFLVHAHCGKSSTLLSAVVLFLHHQIELVETIGPSAVFLLEVVKWLQQSYHCHAAFMLQLFH